MTPADLLALEAQWPSHSPNKDAAIRARGLAPARFYQLLVRAAASADGIAADPLTARRVRERVATRAEARRRRIAP